MSPPTFPRGGQCWSRQARTGGIPQGLRGEARLPPCLLPSLRPPALVGFSPGPPPSSLYAGDLPRRVGSCSGPVSGLIAGGGTCTVLGCCFFLFYFILFYFIFYIAGSYQLSILYILVYICQSQSPSSSHHHHSPSPAAFPLGVHTFVLYICVSISALQTTSSVPFF